MIKAIIITTVLFFSIFASNAQILDSIPFKMKANLIIIETHVNDVKRNFIFDTGAEASVISKTIVDSLEPIKNSESAIRDSNKIETSTFQVLSKKFRIGNQETANQKLYTIESPMLDCLAFDGIIGIDIIKKNDWIIDFKKKMLYKYDLKNNLFVNTNLIFADYYNKGLRPRVKLLFMNKQKLDFLFDTGASKSDIINSDLKKIATEIVKTTDEISETIGAGSIVNSAFKKNELFVALKNKEFKLKSFDNIEQGENKIGNDFWYENVVYYSFSKKKLAVQKNLSEKEKPSFNITFKVENGKMFVGNLTATEVVKAYKINSGDEVILINKLKFTDNCELINYQLNYKESSIEVELIDKRKVILKR